MLSNFTIRFRSLANGIRLLKEGHFRIFLEELRKRLKSCSLSVGLRRDLEIPFEPPDARIPVSVRPLEDGDFRKLIGNGEISKKWPRIVQQREMMLRADLQTCYITVTKENEPCYMQWLSGHDQNHKIRALFGDTFPTLNPDEALLEAAFMHPDYRGLRIMPAAMSRIAEKATEMGARYTITFVDIENVPSLKGCKRSGFAPYVLRRDHWFLFRRTITFEPIPDSIRAKYEEVTGGGGDERGRPSRRRRTHTENRDRSGHSGSGPRQTDLHPGAGELAIKIKER